MNDEREERDPPQAGFRSVDEFVEVMNRTLSLMSEDPEMGPRLRDADVTERFEFSDFDLVVNVRPGGVREPNLVWEWSDQIDWEPRVRLAMSSQTANRYFQGRENVALAIARRRIRATGDPRAAIALWAIVKPRAFRYRELVAAEYPHLRL